MYHYSRPSRVGIDFGDTWPMHDMEFLIGQPTKRIAVSEEKEEEEPREELDPAIWGNLYKDALFEIFQYAMSSKDLYAWACQYRDFRDLVMSKYYQYIPVQCGSGVFYEGHSWHMCFSRYKHMKPHEISTILFLLRQIETNTLGQPAKPWHLRFLLIWMFMAESNLNFIHLASERTTGYLEEGERSVYINDVDERDAMIHVWTNEVKVAKSVLQPWYKLPQINQLLSMHCGRLLNQLNE